MTQKLLPVLCLYVPTDAVEEEVNPRHQQPATIP